MARAPSSAPAFDWRDRVLDLRRIAPADLADHPLQHKTHPAFQQEVMRGVLREVGIADVLRAYQSPTTGALTLIDGHMRKHLGDQPWPTLILDVDDDEAAYLLATGDEIGLLAEKDATALRVLLEEIQSGEVVVQTLLSTVAAREGIIPPAFSAASIDEQGRLDQKAPITCPACGAEFAP